MTPLENPVAFGMSNNIIGFIYLISSIILSLFILFTKYEKMDDFKQQIYIIFGTIFLIGVISIALSSIHFRYEEETQYNAVGNRVEPVVSLVAEALVFAQMIILLMSFKTTTIKVNRPRTDDAFDSSKVLFCFAIIIAAAVGIAMYAKQTNIEEYYEYKNLDQL